MANNLQQRTIMVMIAKYNQIDYRNPKWCRDTPGPDQNDIEIKLCY